MRIIKSIGWMFAALLCPQAALNEMYQRKESLWQKEADRRKADRWT